MTDTDKGQGDGRAAARRRRARSIGGTALSLLLTMLGLLLVTFIIGRVMPIDPVLKVVGDRASQAQYDAAYQAMARAHNPFGDGKAAERIADIIAGKAGAAHLAA